MSKFGDPLDLTDWMPDDTPCRIYDVNMDRYAIVDAHIYPHVVVLWNPYWRRRVPRVWKVKPPHKGRRGSKLYFVNNAGWRRGAGKFLHVEIMERFGPPRPGPKFTIVNHIDGDEWNCQLENLEWSTHLRNRRTKSYGQQGGRARAWASAHYV